MTTPTWDDLYGEGAKAKEAALAIPNLPAIDITDIHALEALAMTELVAIVQTAPRTISKIPAVKELLDRAKGKAPQSIAMTVKTSVIDSMTAQDILAIRNDVARMLGEDVIIVPPMPKKLDIDNSNR